MGEQAVVGKNMSTAPDGRTYALPGQAALTAEFAQIAKRAEEYRDQGRGIVVVQGLGFVGAASAAVIADASMPDGSPRYLVIGVDLARPGTFWKVARLNEGATGVVSPDERLPRMIRRAVLDRGNLIATASQEAYSLADYVVVDVQLDVTNRLTAATDEVSINLEAFKEAIRSVARRAPEEALVLVETTVPVGTCEQVVMPIFQEERARRGMRTPVRLAHAYERVMPGPRYVDSINNYWRTFSGVDQASSRRARAFLESFVNVDTFPLWELQCTNSSEMAKLLENSYRATNIALMHEWTLFAERAGINLFEVVNSIRVRKGTHDNMRFPGFGVGGYCLTKDTLLAQWSANELFGGASELAMGVGALKVNHAMPLHTFDLVKESLGDLHGKEVAVCGITYIADVADSRNSPAEILVDALRQAGARVRLHDPCLGRWEERPDMAVTSRYEDATRGADAVVFAIGHRPYLEMSAERIIEQCPLGTCIVDAQDVVPDEKAGTIVNHGRRVVGVGKGHWRRRGYECHR
jgi:UDP-N-acetyl-D-glucosamine dehydrogenase